MSGFQHRGGQNGGRKPDPFREAQRLYSEALRMHKAGHTESAEIYYREAQRLRSGNADLHHNYALLLEQEGRSAEAAEQCRKALAIRPSFSRAHVTLGDILRHRGDFTGAMAEYDQALAINPQEVQAHLVRGDLKKFSAEDPDLAALESLVATPRLSRSDAAVAHLALAKALEDAGDYERAFEEMSLGNALKRQETEYDEKNALRRFEGAARVFDAGLLAKFAGAGHPSAVPIFVLGMPRSGSTLIEQILASHPQVHAAGEITTFETAVLNVLGSLRKKTAYPEAIADLDEPSMRRIGQIYVSRLPPVPEGKTRVVDKLPGNLLAVGMIRMALPNARIVHTMRNPADTCISCYSKVFRDNMVGYSYDLGELGRYYRGYHDLMAHWRSVLPGGAMLDVQYEAVVDDLEGQARRLIAYCGLEWDERCLNFQNAQRPVRTLSSAQVRQPLFRTSVERWRRYGPGVAPLLEELGALMPRRD
jgi:tetratricopeptide (TPR) repeat protein